MIGQPLADHAREQPVGTIGIIAAGGDAVGVAEIELGEVAVKVLFGAPLIDAAHPAFEDAEEAFDGVSVNVATAIFAGAVEHLAWKA